MTISHQELKRALCFMFPRSEVLVDFDLQKSYIDISILQRLSFMDIANQGVDCLRLLAPRAIPSRISYRRPHRWASAPYNRRKK